MNQWVTSGLQTALRHPPQDSDPKLDAEQKRELSRAGLSGQLSGHNRQAGGQGRRGNLI